MMADHVLEIRELSKDYGDFVLDKVSFTLPRGAIMGLIGENGAGKSTTINCILNETRKSGGQVLLFGRDHIADEIAIKDKLGVVFDENHFPDIFTPEEIGTFMSGIYSGWDWRLYRQYLEKFELPGDKRIKDFSKGMKVKLAFAVALSHNAELLILDEATSGLDPIIRDDVLDMLIDFVQDESHSVLVSSHITSDLEKVADYITFLHRGKLIFSHEKDELIDNFGIVSCKAAVFDAMDKSQIIAYRREDYQYKVLVRDRRAVAKRNPDAVVGPATIEEIMLLAGCQRGVRGDVPADHPAGRAGDLVPGDGQCDHGVCCGELRLEHGGRLCRRRGAFRGVLWALYRLVPQKIRVAAALPLFDPRRPGQRKGYALSGAYPFIYGCGGNSLFGAPPWREKAPGEQ